MNQTQNLKLSQWEKDDRILMEDFNGDNQKIDEMAGKVELLARAVPELVRCVGQLGVAVKYHHDAGLSQRAIWCETFAEKSLYRLTGGAVIQDHTLSLSGQNATGSAELSTVSFSKSDWKQARLTVRYFGGELGVSLNGQPMRLEGATAGQTATGTRCFDADYVLDVEKPSGVRLKLDLSTGSASSMTVYEYTLFLC